MVNYDIIIFIIGVAFLASAWLSPKLTGTPFSLSMIWLGIGIFVSIFGIRGIGSFYYLAYALNQTHYFDQYGQQLWRISILIVLISIVLHGMSASIIFQRLTMSRK